MSTTIMIIACSLVAIAVLIVAVLSVNKSTARRFFIEHYGATDAESIVALEKLADANIFTSLNAAAICVGVRVRKDLQGLTTPELTQRFNGMWKAGEFMRLAHALELTKQVSGARDFKFKLGRLVKDPKVGMT